MMRFFVLAVMAVSLWGQGSTKPYLSSPRRALTAPELKDAPDEWIDRSLQWAGEIFAAYPPAVPEHPVRRAALVRLDDILHIESAPSKPLVQKFYQARMERAVAEIEATRVDAGMRIWKLYNHGWLARTPAVSFCFDIVPGLGKGGFQVERALLERLAGQCDAMFISHEHGDHANAMVAGLFLERGKPVVAAEGIFAGREIAARIAYPKRSATEVHKIAVQNGANCWTNDIGRMARGVNPKLILTGHENEMGHTVDHREDYTQTYNHLFGVPYPFAVMTWGESYLYRK